MQPHPAKQVIADVRKLAAVSKIRYPRTVPNSPGLRERNKQANPMAPADAEMGSAPGSREHRVSRGPRRLDGWDYSGEEQAVVHSFPDNLHLYDCLIAHLNPPRWNRPPPISTAMPNRRPRIPRSVRRRVNSSLAP